MHVTLTPFPIQSSFHASTTNLGNKMLHPKRSSWRSIRRREGRISNPHVIMLNEWSQSRSNVSYFRAFLR